MIPVIIYIKELGSIKEAKVQLSSMMLFLGESGLGKSYVAMICHYIYELLLSSRLSRFFQDKGIDFNEMKPSFKDKGIAYQFSKSEFEKWISINAIEYLRDMLNYPELNASIEIEFQLEQKDFIIEYEEVLLGLIDSDEVYINLTMNKLTYRVKNVGIDDESPFSFLFRHSLMKSIFGDYKKINSSYIFPPGKAIALTEQVSPIMGLYKRYLEWRKTMPYHSDEDSRNDTLDRIIQEVIQGKIKRKDGEFIYITESNTELPVSASASSIRELAPLVYLISRRDMKGCSLLIEEPEAHLHPSKQRKMADLIACLKHIGTHMQITTHSDYFLKRLNELLKLNKVRKSFVDKYGEEEGSNRFETECEKNNIDSRLVLSNENNDISAYYFYKDGDFTKISKEEDLTEGGLSFETFLSVLEEDIQSSGRIDNLIDDIFDIDYI